MMKTGFKGVLWLLFLSVSEKLFLTEPNSDSLLTKLQAATTAEELHTLKEGQTLRVIRHVSIWKYPNSQKAWQRLPSEGKPQTLAVTEKPSGTVTRVQVGRYILEDNPSEAILRVQMTDLQVEDTGLYRCVIFYTSKEPDILSLPIRLFVTKDSSGTTVLDKTLSQKVPKVSTLPPATIQISYIFSTSPWTVTQPLPETTTSISTPGDGVINGTDATRTSVISISTAVVCGVLGKSLIITILFVVTQRSFGS